VSSASDEIRAAIAVADVVHGTRAISFRDFMELALYGVGGFYATVGSAGRRGDFITGPEVGPLFGAVLARALDAWWDELGQPDPFTVVDAGAGPGTLARSIRAAAPRCIDATRYIAVEVSAAQRERHPEWVTSVAEMPTDRFTGVVIANELLDNLAFRLFVNDGGWREAYVIDRADGTFAEVLRAAPDLDVLSLPVDAAHGARVPVQACGAWVQHTLACLDRGRVVIIDYASATTAALAARPYREWLRTYRGHERGSHYLRDPGSQDITTEVALDQLFRIVGEPAAVRTQAQFLRRWGIDGLVDEGRRVWAEHAARPTVAAMTMRSRVREAEALCDPDGLGAFTVVEYTVA
jgi:SAM-dependent MidA family methyltransferase